MGGAIRGLSMIVAGSNPNFAMSNGIDVDKQRIKGTVISTVLAAIGIIIYSQAFGFLQLYNAPLYSAMPAAAAILIGGATLKKSKYSACNSWNTTFSVFISSSTTCSECDCRGQYV